MLRRSAIALLVVAIGISSIAICPRGVLACARVMRASHRCCLPTSGVRAASTCCCRGDTQGSALLGAFDAKQDRLQASKVLVTTAALPVAHVGASCLRGAQLLRTGGLPPLDTLVSRYTSLLL